MIQHEEKKQPVKKSKEARPARGLGRKRRCEIYRLNGRREENKRRKKENYKRHMLKAKARREKKAIK